MKSLLSLVVLTFLIFALSRGLIRALPGDPIETLIAETGIQISTQELRREFKLDLPFMSAMKEDLISAAHGDWGTSIHRRQPVGRLVFERAKRTTVLVILTLIIGCSSSLFIGILAARFPNSNWSTFCSFYGGLAAALPMPWIAPILMYLLCVLVPIFPIADHPLLPAIALAIGFSGFWSRLIRERVSKVLTHGSAQGARARGLSETRVLLLYGLAPALGSLLGYLGTQIGSLLTGSFVVEIIFGWDGLGSLFIDAVLERDYPIVEAAVFWGAWVSLLGTRIGDWLQRWVDPRIASTV